MLLFSWQLEQRYRRYHIEYLRKRVFLNLVSFLHGIFFIRKICGYLVKLFFNLQRLWPIVFIFICNIVRSISVSLDIGGIIFQFPHFFGLICIWELSLWIFFWIFHLGFRMLDNLKFQFPIRNVYPIAEHLQLYEDIHLSRILHDNHAFRFFSSLMIRLKMQVFICFLAITFLLRHLIGYLVCLQLTILRLLVYRNITHIF